MRQHRAELRRDISPELAVRLALDDRPLTHARVANLLSLKTADGDPIEGRKKHSAGADGKRPPVGFIDLTLSAPKSLSVAWALASTADEREQLLGIHRTAVEKTMQYVAEEIGHTQRGGSQNRWSQPGEIAWIGFQRWRCGRPQERSPNGRTGRAPGGGCGQYGCLRSRARPVSSSRRAT